MNPLVDGSTKSPVVTDTQKEIKDIFAYFTKIALATSMEETVYSD